MTNNKRDLTAYVRYDATNRVVAGSLVLRRSKPKNGNWKEVQTYECCNDVTITTTVSNSNIILLGLRLFCNGVTIGTYNTNDSTTTIEDVAILLNITYGMLGVFAVVDEGTISFTVSIDQKKALCPIGTLSFSILDLD